MDYLNEEPTCKDILSGKRVLRKVAVLHGLFGRDALVGVHQQQLLQQMEGLALGLDFVPLHVLDQRAAQVAARLQINWGPAPPGGCITWIF